MRTLVAAILLATLIVTGVAIVVPLIARPMIVAAVQAASPFGDQPLDIDVDCNVFGLLTGTVDRLRVRGSDLKRGDVEIGALDITLTDVATSGREFRGSSGTVASITIPVEPDAIKIDQIELSGSSAALSAVASMGRASGTAIIESAFADAGFDATGVDLGAGTVAFNFLGSRASVQMGVVDGAIVLVDPFGQGDFEVLRPDPKDGWQLTGIVVRPDGLTVDGRLDVERLLALH